MTYVQATSGGGGWPMSVFLTPQLHPVLGGTYFPPEDMPGRPGFKTLLRCLLVQHVTPETRSMQVLRNDMMSRCKDCAAAL